MPKKLRSILSDLGVMVPTAVVLPSILTLTAVAVAFVIGCLTVNLSLPLSLVGVTSERTEPFSGQK